MKQLLECLSIASALGVVAGFLTMNFIALSYDHLPMYMRLPFAASVGVFFFCIVLSFVLWMLGAWYDRRIRRNSRISSP